MNTLKNPDIPNDLQAELRAEYRETMKAWRQAQHNMMESGLSLADGARLLPSVDWSCFMVLRCGAKTKATKAANEANTPQARRSRMVDVLAATDPMKAEQFRAQGLQTDAAEVQLTRAQEAAKRDQALREMGGLILKGGWASVPEVYNRYQDGNTATVKPDGKGGAVVTQIGPDGKPVGEHRFGSLLEFFEQAAGRREEVARQQSNADRDYQLRLNADRRAASAEARAVARQAAEDKLPPAVRAQYESVREQIKAINAAMTKSQADGMWDPKSPGAKAILKNLDALHTSANRLLTPYLPAAVREASGDDQNGSENGGGSTGTQRPAAASTTETPKCPVLRARMQEVARDPLEMASDRDLQRIANIQGQANQERAAAILAARHAQRAKQRAEDEAAVRSGYGMSPEHASP
ncbi:hypothetical protein [Caldimonas taiwanensis]|uniref:hypothetical protein n=1 Tax=Caldimonas taiwanensis TaxID=307483 RepID=UPI00078358CA|nr:hypothetical protein [Caldimonas taiwanensis]